jgi:hypothetical protein
MASSLFEPVALGPASVANENSKTEPIPRIPQNNQGNGTRFGIVAVTPQAGGLRPFIRHECIGDRLEDLLICRGYRGALAVNFTICSGHLYFTFGQKGSGIAAHG